MQRKRAKAKQEYQKAKKKHDEHRESFLDKLKPKDRDRLKRVEKQRELGRCAKAITGKLESKSVTKVEDNDVEYTTQADIERILLEVNLEKSARLITLPL